MYRIIITCFVLYSYSIFILGATTNNKSDSCGQDKFTCSDESCVGLDARCDGIAHCLDSSDEADCKSIQQPYKCPLPLYPANGTYEVMGLLFPGEVFLSVTCKEGYQMTGYPLVYCLGGAWDRDLPECISPAPPDNYLNKSCSTDEFSCTDGSCVSLGARCDGKADCTDRSDEAACKGIQKPDKCIVPPHPSHGRFSLDSFPDESGSFSYATPGKAYDTLVLWVYCDKEYIMANVDNFMHCDHGTWMNDIPKCTKRLCKLKQHPSVKYYCRVSGSTNKTRICHEHEVSGTVVRAECNKPIYYSPKTLPTMTCFDGKWDKVVTCPSASSPTLLTTIENQTDSCSLNEIMCSEGKCVSFDVLCDGKEDCLDGRDEAVCEATPRPKTCVLPPYPEHGTYIVNNKPDAVPGQDFDSLQLTVSCDAGYKVKRPNIVFCLDGVWFGSMPQCKRYCKLDQQPNVHYRCLIPGSKDTRICNAYEPSGTVVQAECNAPNYYSPYALPSMRCVNGSWNEIVTCIPECGRVAPQGEPLMIGGRRAVNGELPWHAGIVSKEIPFFYHITCGGTIVSSTVVISAASCFRPFIAPYTSEFLYAVAVGTLYRMRNFTSDPDSQLSNVIDIHVPQHYKSGTVTRQANIAMVLVATPFVYNVYVRPICLSFDFDFESRQLQPGSMGKIAGWGYTSGYGTSWAEELQVVELPFVDVDKCYEASPPELAGLITNDKFCAGYTNDTAATCFGDIGGGLVFPELEQGVKRYYLRGILSGPIETNFDDTCTVNIFSVFTHISSHEHFIKKDLATGFCKLTRHPSVKYRCIVPGFVNETRICNNYEPSGTVVRAECNAPDYHSTYTLLPMTCTNGNWNKIVTCTPVVKEKASSGACVVPPDPDHGTYKVNNAPDATPGQAFEYLHLNLVCYDGYGVVGPDYVVCANGVWLGSIPKCERFCKLESHPSVHYQCLVTGSVVGTRRCNAYEPSGTVVRPECNAPNYYSTYSLPSMTCTDGSWNEVFTCLPECGRVTPEGRELVIGGRRTKKGELPWHAGIYVKTYQPYKQICGGSLVRNTVVISAAHCFWNDVDKQRPAADYAVAVGKLFRPWHIDHHEDSQHSDVSAIHLPPHFQGSTTNFQDDIAIVVTATAFEYKTHVRPVCLNFNINFERWQLQPGSMGKVAGWGLTAANGPASAVLLATELPYVEINQCYRISSFGFQQYITSDKICAGNNGSTLCEGDSGGGLSFPELEQGKERYYLRGIVSTAPSPEGQDKCNAHALITFTNILKHDPFIQNYL